MTLAKAILIPGEATDRLTEYVAALALPRRACSLPIAPGSGEGLTSFIELWGDTRRLREIASDWPVPVRAWLVDEYVPMAYERTWPSGVSSPGVRMISTIHRREGMTRREFADYWLGPHTEVAKRYTVPVWHYSQNIVIESLRNDTGSRPVDSEDGFVGMHFRSADDMRARWQDHPSEAEAGARDAAKFMTVARSVSMAAVETVWETATRT